MVDDDDGRTDDGRTPDHGHPISSPCEPNGSGELKKDNRKRIFVFEVNTKYVSLSVENIRIFMSVQHK